MLKKEGVEKNQNMKYNLTSHPREAIADLTPLWPLQKKDKKTSQN